MRIEQQGGGEVLLPVSEVKRRYGFGQTKLYQLLQAGEIEELRARNMPRGKFAARIAAGIGRMGGGVE